MHAEASTQIGELINKSAKILDIFSAVDRVRQIRREGIPPGLTTGWTKFDQFFKFPPMGQLNVVTGFPGSGKSEWLDSLALNMAVKHDWKIFNYSPENYPAEYHLQKLCEKLAGKPFCGNWVGWENVNDDDINLFERLMAENYTFIDCHINSANIDEILNSIFLECINRRVNMAIIDPWNKLESQRGPGQNETDFVGQCLTRIQMFTRQKGISFWIVAHPSKPMKNKDGSLASLSLYDISGSAHWYNMVDDGFIVHRNWDDKIGTQNITKIKIAKIKDRRYGKCGEHQFQFEPATGNYREM